MNNDINLDDLNKNTYVVPSTTTTSEVHKPASQGWSWILLVVAMLFIIGFLIWFIFWSTETPKSSNNNVGLLSITGTNFVVLANASIQGTWVSVGDARDLVTLYVAPTGQGLRFDNSGNPSANYLRSSPVSVPNTTATVSGLTVGVTYDAALVVTNPNVPNLANVVTKTGLTISSPIIPDKFSITATSAPSGAVRYYPNTGNSAPVTVVYTPNDASANGTLFHQDPNGYICTTNQTQPITTSSTCDGGSVLYAKPSANGSEELGITLKSNTTDQQAQWRYNTGNNTWCLGSSNRCMAYNPHSNSFFVNTTTGVTGSSGGTGTTGGNHLINVSTSGTPWLNKSHV